jgi:multidrug resistance efflux pump
MVKDKRLDPAQVQRDLELFAAALKESEKADKAAKEKERTAREERERTVAAANAKERNLADAKRELDRAVEGVRRAKASGRGRAEADAAWKVAKARVIELETGTAPSWAPKPEPVNAGEPDERAAEPDESAGEPTTD